MKLARWRTVPARKWVLLAAGVLLVLAVDAVFVYFTTPLSDFVSFWSAGRWLLLGRDPYTLSFRYPLWFAIFFVPFGALPFLPSAVLWLALNQAMFAGAVISAIRLSGARLKGREVVLLTLAMLFFAPTLETFLYEQSSVMVLLLVTVAALTWQRGHSVTAGLIMALALIKPHITWLIVAYWLLGAIAQNDWKVWRGFAAGLLALLILPTLVQPGWAGSWIGVWQAGIVAVVAGTPLQPLTGVVNTPIVLLAGISVLGLWVIVLLALVFALNWLTLLIGSRPPFIRGLTVIVPLALVFSLRPGTYDLILLVLPLVLLAVHWRRVWLYALPVGMLLLTIGLVMLGFPYQNEWLTESICLGVAMGTVVQDRRRIGQAARDLISLLRSPVQKWPVFQRQALLRMSVILGMIAAGFYWTWWHDTYLFSNVILLGLLSAAWTINTVQIISVWYVYLNVSIPDWCPPAPRLRVDVFVTACGESLPLIERALCAAVTMRYPHRTYLLDDGEDPDCRDLAARLGAGYITRPDRRDAKAGNLNHALAQTDGEFIAIFDVDHAPAPNFLDRVLGHFENPRIGFVQVMLSHCNQNESFVARACSEQTYDAFGPTFMGMHGCGGATAIGSNCTIRRETLEDIGGYQPGLAEDLNTSIHIHARGWESVYVPEVLAWGLEPSDLAAFFKQQLKWSSGVLQIFIYDFYRLARRLTWGQRVCYLCRMSNYLVGPGIAINQLFLILYLLFGEMLARIDFAVYLVHWLPFLMLTLLIRQFALAAWQPDPAAMGYHIRGASLVYGTWPVYTLALLSTMLGIRVPFIATPKEKRGGNYIGLVIPQIIVVLLLMLSIGWRIGHGFVDFDVIVMGLAGLSILMHGSVFYAVWEGFQIRAQQTHAEPVWGVPAVGQE